MAKAPISLIAAFYSTDDVARLVLDNLKQMHQEGAIKILDAAIMVHSEEAGKIQIKETAELSGAKGAASGAGVGAVIGLIFPPAILATAAIGAAAGAAFSHFTDQGFDNNLLKEIGENLPPGGSAIVAVVEETWFARLSSALTGYSQISRYAMDPEAGAHFLSQSEPRE
jgi:uncharacterized membrane protein